MLVMNSGENDKQGKRRTKILKKLGKRGLTATITIGTGLVVCLIWFYIVPLLQQPMPPSVIPQPGSNPVVNTANTQTITITATPAFKPAYSNDIVETIQNPNDYRCYMVLEFRASDGFKFLPLKGKLPANFKVEEGFEYRDVMTVAIDDFPPMFSYDLTLSLYTVNPDTFAGTEQITAKTLTVQKQ
jgi:hypothetical protein